MVERRLICFSLFAVLLIMVSGCDRSQPVGGSDSPQSTVNAEQSDAEAVNVGTVTIEIDSDDEPLVVKIDGVRQGETLESVMRRIDQVPITINGSGPTAFVNQIGDRATGLSEGWTYRVDGEFAMKGIGQLELNPPTTIRWSYGTMADDSGSL